MSESPTSKRKKDERADRKKKDQKKAQKAAQKARAEVQGHHVHLKEAASRTARHCLDILGAGGAVLPSPSIHQNTPLLHSGRSKSTASKPEPASAGICAELSGPHHPPVLSIHHGVVPDPTPSNNDIMSLMLKIHAGQAAAKALAEAPVPLAATSPAQPPTVVPLAATSPAQPPAVVPVATPAAPAPRLPAGYNIPRRRYSSVSSSRSSITACGTVLVAEREPASRRYHCLAARAFLPTPGTIHSCS